MTSSSTSLRQLARLIGVSEKAVRKAFARGVFRLSVQRDPAGTPVVVDVGAAVDDWERSGRQLRGSARARAASKAPTEEPAGEAQPVDEPVPPDRSGLADGDETTPPSLADAQRITMLERARKLKLENDLREGQLVEADKAQRVAFEFARILREQVLNVPARLSAELAAESDAGRVFMRLDAALREALEATAAALEAAG